MAGRHRLRGGVLLAAGLMLGGPAAAGEPALVASPDLPGSQHPVAGLSLFDELFGNASGHDIPFPFAQLIDALNARIAPERVRTALIPLGRSLQRYSAAPDYFASPRLVVAVTSDATDDGEPTVAPRLKDRLFIGYQPAAEVLEIISYNEAAGRYEFQEVVDYGPGLSPRASYAHREICVTCHQAHAPIFSRPLWSESNANPEVSARLSTLGASYHGAPVRQGIDSLDDFDQSTDRANRIAVVNRIWDEGCGEAAPGTACRAMLLEAALHYRLTGARIDWSPPARPDVSEELLHRMAGLWPGGLAGADPDLPNADPVAELAAGRPIAEILEPTGAADPAAPRAPIVYWMPGADVAGNLAAVARALGAQFAAADIAWLERRLAGRPANAISHRADCAVERIARPESRLELRLACGGDDGAIRAGGFVVLDGNLVTGGRIETLAVGAGAPIRQLRVVGGAAGAETVSIELRDSGAGLLPRLLSGERISAVRLGSDDVIEVDLIDDMDELRAAIAVLTRGDDGALGPGPMRRRAVIRGIDAAFPEP